MIWEKQSGGLFRSNLIINLKCPIYKAFESFVTQNGNIFATIKYSQKIKSYQTSSPIALFVMSNLIVYYLCLLELFQDIF